MLSHARAVVTLDVRGGVGDPTSTRDEDNSLYISGANLNLMSQFYGVGLGLKSTL